jgi:hypothetical protein
MRNYYSAINWGGGGGTAIYCTPFKACSWTKSKRPSAEQRSPDEQNEARFISPFCAAVIARYVTFFSNLLITIKTPHSSTARLWRFFCCLQPFYELYYFLLIFVKLKNTHRFTIKSVNRKCF